jgi:putative DNA primase/helicase
MFIEFAQGQKHALKGADTSEYHEAFQDAGYLLRQDDLIVDIDNLGHEPIREMIRIFNIDTQVVWTGRGAHLYFTKPKGFKSKSEAVCPLGFKVEYKTNKNTPNGITIKRDGTLREIDNFGERQPIPDFLFMNKNFENLLGLGDGDGRDNKLYAHKFKIMTIENYKKVLRFINNNVLAEPFSEEDFQRIAREEELKADDGEEYNVAMFLKRQLNIVEFADRFYIYDGKQYVNCSNTDNLKREIAKYLKGKPSRYIEEVAKQLALHPTIIEQPVKGFDIKFKNGILRNGKFIEVDSTEFTPYYIDIEYNEDAEPVQAVDDYLNQLTEGDEDYTNVVLEMMAHPLITNVEFKRKLARFSIIIGKGGEGKGTLLEIIAKILGKDNCSYNSIKKLPDERYAYDIEGKLANLGDDIEDAPITNEEMKMLKNISTCDPVMVRALHKMARNTRLTASLIFTSNHMLKTHEKGDSYKRRVVWCPMFNKPENADAEIITKLTSDEALEYWIKLIMEAYFRLYETKTFTHSSKVDTYTAQYHSENNTCQTWVQDREPNYFIGKRPPEIYTEYEIWAMENEGRAQSARSLKNTIEAEHGLIVKAKKVNGKTAKVYALQ